MLKEKYSEIRILKGDNIKSDKTEDGAKENVLVEKYTIIPIRSQGEMKKNVVSMAWRLILAQCRTRQGA